MSDWISELWTSMSDLDTTSNEDLGVYHREKETRRLVLGLPGKDDGFPLGEIKAVASKRREELELSDDPDREQRLQEVDEAERVLLLFEEEAARIVLEHNEITDEEYEHHLDVLHHRIGDPSVSSLGLRAVAGTAARRYQRYQEQRNETVIATSDNLDTAPSEDPDGASSDGLLISEDIDEGTGLDFAPPVDPYSVSRSPVGWVAFQARTFWSAVAWRFRKGERIHLGVGALALGVGVTPVVQALQSFIAGVALVGAGIGAYQISRISPRTPDRVFKAGLMLPAGALLLMSVAYVAMLIGAGVAFAVIGVVILFSLAMTLFSSGKE